MNFYGWNPAERVGSTRCVEPGKPEKTGYAAAGAQEYSRREGHRMIEAGLIYGGVSDRYCGDPAFERIE